MVNCDGLTPQKLKEYADEALSTYQKIHEKNLSVFPESLERL